MCKSKNNLLAILAFAVFSLSAFACGPMFPNSYLMGGDDMLTDSPRFKFYEEIDRIQLEKPAEFQAVYDVETISMDLQELSEALEAQGHTSDSIKTTTSKYKSIREAINQYKWNCQRQDFDPVEDTGKKAGPKVTFSTQQIPNEVPAEFSLYLQGVSHYQTGNLAKAIDAWLKILQLPPGQRRYRTTWSLYMLGLSAKKHRPHIASLCFQRVRQLARRGFPDSLGLAASSYGQEAAVYLAKEQYTQAIELYLQQKQTGDHSARASLLFVSSEVFKNCGTEEISELIKHPLSRQVLASYAVSYCRPYWSRSQEQDAGHAITPQKTLLEAIELAHLDSVEKTDQMAMIAYQAGNFQKARLWLNVANRDSLISRRVRAKLYLMEGKIKKSAEDLAFIARQTGPGELMCFDEHDYTDTPYKIYSELGSLYVSQAMYLQALDTLMHGGNWIDAAYIAERVLTPPELQHYVDINWPPEPPVVGDSSETFGDLSAGKATRIRYLLARRLTRLQQYDNARYYYPEECLNDFDTFVAALEKGNNPQLPDDQRADALWTAAWLARHRGMELMGTELAPDAFFYYKGNLRIRNALDVRVDALETNQFNIPTQDEINRSQQHMASPFKRFHYRYIASDLAWEAAALMQNESPELARRLCLAGSWTKILAPKHADVFYKSLVLRCGTTDLGKEADKLRWFPKIPDTLKAETPLEVSQEKEEVYPTDDINQSVLLLSEL